MSRKTDHDTTLGDLVHGTKKTNVLTLQNWLYKRSPSIAKAWQRRWFVLQGDVVTYYKKNEPVGELVLHYHTVVSDTTVSKKKKTKVFFNITTPDRTFELRCDDPHVATKWVNECRNVVRNKKETSVSLSNEPVLAPSSFLAGFNNDGADESEEPLPGNGRAKGRSTVRVKSSKVEKMLGLQLEQQAASDDKDDIQFEFKYRANIRYMMEKYRNSMSKAVSLRAPETNGGDGVYRILCLDGGGIRGVMHAVLLERLCKQFPSLLDNVDMIAGTSGGAIIASALASNFPPAFARRVLDLAGNLVFSKKTIKTMSTAKYAAKWLKTTLEEIAADKKLNDLPRKLVIPAFQLDSFNPQQPEGVRRWGATVSHNIGRDSNGNVPVVDAILRTIAAPTYFPSYQGYIDGGVFAHNPTMTAVSLALSTQYEAMTPNKIVVLSLGTGRVARYLPTDNNEEYDWGLMQWAPKITDLMLDASCTATNLLAESMLGPRYHRVDPWYKTDVAMDDPGLLPALSTLANELDVSATLQWISDVFMPKSSAASTTTPTEPTPTPVQPIVPPIVPPIVLPIVPQDATPEPISPAVPVDSAATPPSDSPIIDAEPSTPSSYTTPSPLERIITGSGSKAAPGSFVIISRQTRLNSTAEDTIHELKIQNTPRKMQSSLSLAVAMDSESSESDEESDSDDDDTKLEKDPLPSVLLSVSPPSLM